MANQIIKIPVVLADADWFLSESLNAAAISKTAADFSNGQFCQGGYPQRVAFKTDQAVASTVVVTYYSPEGDAKNLRTDTLSVSSAAVSYTSLPVYKLVSVTATKVTGATLSVGFQGYPYYWLPNKINHDHILSAGFVPTYIASAGHTGIAKEVEIATEGTPAANKVGYDRSSRTLHYCYPQDGSGNNIGGILVVHTEL